MAEKIIAPFSLEQVNALNAYQALGYVHEFTCPGENGHPAGKSRKLVATSTGWFCPWCSYRQDWAYDFMADQAKHPANPLSAMNRQGGCDMTQSTQSDVSELPKPAHSDAVVEKVARAIYEDGLSKTAAHWPKLNERQKAEWRSMARAALSVIPQDPALMECVEALKEIAGGWVPDYCAQIDECDNLIDAEAAIVALQKRAQAALSRLQAQGNTDGSDTNRT